VKKILGLSIAIVLVIGLVAGGTWAYFSDTETTTGNVFTAGTIDISLDPAGGQDVFTLEDFDIELKPCQTGYTVVNITNDGDNPCEVWKHIANVENREHGIMDAEQEFYDANPGSDTWLMSNWIHYDMFICSYSEECGDEEDFEKVQTNEPDYEFDVCRTIEGGNAKWTLDFDASTVPSLSASEVQVVISSDGATPDFLVGCNCHEACPLYKPYSGGWGSATNVLPVGMSVTGNCGDAHFEIEIPLYYCNCPDFYWAMSVGADFAGSAGMVHYRAPSASGWWGSIPFYADNCNCTEIIPESAGFMLTGPHNAGGVECFWIYLGVLEPGQSMFVLQSYHLDASVENWAQSDRVFFDMEFFAQQTEGEPPAPPPGNELPGYGKP